MAFKGLKAVETKRWKARCHGRAFHFFFGVGAGRSAGWHGICGLLALKACLMANMAIWGLLSIKTGEPAGVKTVSLGVQKAYNKPGRALPGIGVCAIFSSCS